MSESVHLRLAGVTRLGVDSPRGPRDVFLFDPHRLALPCWALALEGREPAALLTLDRHFDLVVPEDPAAIPGREAGLRAIDEHARWSLDVRNFDHIVAACEAGLLGELYAVARAWPREAKQLDVYRDRHGAEHRVARTPTIDRLAEGWGTASESEDAARLRAWVGAKRPLILDVDLDCFTTPSDADPMTIVPWPEPLIREFLLPPESERFWDEVLGATVTITIAREPYHTGGVIAGDRLFEAFARVFFGELLRVDLP